ncbi:hypothetical protein QFC19_007130 [Naganishia cerealis]|uniref:Uncharacterized protein n=1 Tax=Naganishia cerealis TaxID=610337 RepID=A0ACC2VCB9_9TREE|nr:hypothetical protein QFC19_007130 [Naganishia cerealis]
MDPLRKSQPVDISMNSLKLVSFADLLDEQLPSPPASFTQIIDAYSREGKGDVETLKSVLAAKQAEEDRPTHPLPVATRNRKRSTSPVNYSTMLPPMRLARAHDQSLSHDRTLPSLTAQLSSSSSVSSPSAISDRFLRAPREYSYASESDRTEAPVTSAVAGRKRAYTMDSENATSSATGVYYQARDKHLLPSPKHSGHSFTAVHESSSARSNPHDGEASMNKRLRADDVPLSRPRRCRNGLELLLNAAGRSDSEESR